MRDVEALYGALVWVRTHEEEARAMGERARAYVQAELDIRSVIPRYEAVYEACGWGTK
jgi:glycosyltransferase involved in cell wall biosynthesis